MLSVAVLHLSLTQMDSLQMSESESESESIVRGHWAGVYKCLYIDRSIGGWMGGWMLVVDHDRGGKATIDTGSCWNNARRRLP
jgi:hypothetical protein